METKKTITYAELLTLDRPVRSPITGRPVTVNFKMVRNAFDLQRSPILRDFLKTIGEGPRPM